MSRIRFLRSLLVAGGVCALLVFAIPAQAQQYGQAGDQSQANDNSDQAPGRVARLAYLSGQVQFAPAGENDWGSVEVNRPMVIGDRLLTGVDGRAVIELGDASVRIAHDSAFDFLNLDANNIQIELSQGTLNLAVRQMNEGGNFEVDTPTVAFVASTPGVYRIDDDPSGTGSMVTVVRGSGIVYGANGVSRQVAEGTSYRFDDSTLASVEVNALPQPDDFDRFCETRDANYTRYVQQGQQYVPPDMIGGDQLYQYGQWNAVPQYGNVWYPDTVPAGWAPYRYGHWAWIDPWGWTWVDDQPWGFAPFHYGRWAYISNRWGWMPGPVDVQPVYAPALVAFIGGSGFSLSIGIGGGGPVGWFPLGPRDVYVPWFPASRGYFTNVNVTNIRNVYVNKTVINNIYNDYSQNKTVNIDRYNHYAYRNLPGAVTAVPRNVFVDARPVHPAVLKLDRTQLARASVAVRPAVDPRKASLGVRQPSARPTVMRGHQPFAQPVVARHAPPPRPVGFSAREKVIASQHGQPLTTAQIQDLRKTHPATEARDERVKLVPAAAAVAGAAAIGAARRGATSPPHAKPAASAAPAHPEMAQHPAQPASRPVTAPKQSFKDTVHPIAARNPPAQPALRPGELPSARFAHPGESRTLPRAAEIRAAREPAHTSPQASGRLPVVKPVERAQPAIVTGQQQRQADIVAQQRARAQQQQVQRQARDQAAQRARTQQLQQQQPAPIQGDQRAREQAVQQQRIVQERATQERAQQMQQQRQAQVQAEQRGREQQMQQQRQMQQMRMQQAQQAEQRAVRERAMQRAPERNAPRPAPERRSTPPPKKPPDSSSGNMPNR